MLAAGGHVDESGIVRLSYNCRHPAECSLQLGADVGNKREQHVDWRTCTTYMYSPVNEVV